MNALLGAAIVVLLFAGTNSTQYTWIGFGEREDGDQLIIVDHRVANSTKQLFHSLTFRYEVHFTFANLTLTDGFDQVIHTYDEYFSNTEVNFNNTTFSEAHLELYGRPFVNLKKENNLLNNKTKKIVFTNFQK